MMTYDCSQCHEVCGSTSPVLTGTGFVNGKGQFSIPYRIDTPQLITKKLSQVIMSATATAVPNLVHIHPWEASGRMSEI